MKAPQLSSGHPEVSARPNIKEGDWRWRELSSITADLFTAQSPGYDCQFLLMPI